MAPFPFRAHQAGRADLPHPAFPAAKRIGHYSSTIFLGPRGNALQRASYSGRKTSRGDIIIGRPALILKARPSTYDTISHSYGLHDDETLPVAQRQTSISNSSFFAPASKARAACRVKANGRMAWHAEILYLTSPG